MAKLPYLSHEPPKTWQDANRIAASKMAMQGFPVFPCYAFGQDKSGRNLAKRPVGPWKHWRARAWQEIDALWRGEWSEYLPAISLEAHDLVVFDPDVRDACNGLEAWERLCRENPLPAGVPLVSTAGGGLHVYFKQRPDHKLGNGEGGLPKGVNVRGAGGLVIAPGAMLPDGRQWAYREGTVFRSAPVIPDWLFNLVRGVVIQNVKEVPIITNIPPISQGGSRYWDKAFTDEISKLAATPAGGRNNALNDAAFAVMQMVMLGAIDRTAAINSLVDASHANGLVLADGMPQVMQTIMSGFAGAEKKPRAMPDIKLEKPRLEAPRCHGDAIDRAPSITEGEIAQALRFMFRGQFPEVERTPIIKNAIPRVGTGFMSGQSRAGKTFLALDLAVAVASGKEVWGWSIREPVGVAYISGEGAGKIEDRLEAAERARGITEPLPIMICKKPGNLLDAKNLESLIQDLAKLEEEMVERWGVRVGLVIIDTLSACFWMQNENDAAQAAHVCRIMEQISAAVDGFTLTLHHSAKDALVGGRGSGAFMANVDQWFNVVALRDETDQLQGRALYLAKNREGEEISFGEFRIESFEIRKDMDGDPVAPGVIRMGQKQIENEGDTALKNPTEHDSAFLEALSRCDHFAHDVARGASVVAVYAAHVKEEFHKRYPHKQQFYRAKNRLIKSNAIGSALKNGHEIFFLKDQ